METSSMSASYNLFKCNIYNHAAFFRE